MARADGILALHAVTGLLGTLAAVWVFVELLNARDRNSRRTHYAAVTCAVLMWLSFVLGGYWYVALYGADRAVIVAGAEPWAHAIFMEAKEHLFFILLLSATYLPMLVSDRHLNSNRSVRRLALVIAASIAVLGVVMERFGSIVSMGVRAGLVR